MGTVLELVVPLGEVNQLLQLFQKIGYKVSKKFPAHVSISLSTGLAQVYCLEKKIRQNPSDVCTPHDTTSFSDIVDRCDTYIHSKTERIIRVVYANSASPLGPLLDAHSTLVLNYISWNSVCKPPR